jgi:hypothetical protein
MTRRQFLFLPLTLLAPTHPQPEPQLHEKYIQAIEMMADSFQTLDGENLRYWLTTHPVVMSN